MNDPLSCAVRLSETLGKIAADSSQHPHAVRAAYDDEVATRLDGSTDPDLRALAEAEALREITQRFRAIGARLRAARGRR